mmetsp:Transcript_31334/g.82119  ORF Transcript_31334/g.82119 Transcript_31334/m.82119 type:complete len:108 (-) Transcript_31334:124-447(-)
MLGLVRRAAAETVRAAGPARQVSGSAAVLAAKPNAKATKPTAKPAGHIHDVAGGKDSNGYFGRAIEYTELVSQSYNTFYDLEVTMRNSRCEQPKPGDHQPDRLTENA